ncbi:MAG TPA: tetratricopeptide repeat protein, partial [Pyrinomonadaceae bacterium]
ANEAVRLAPSDPQAHQARAIVLNNLRLPVDAAREMEIAVSLRPHDDYLWLELGALRDVAGHTDAALAAFDRAVAFAPDYGHTHWQRGNLLVRMRKYDEGFKELRTAVSSNRDFLPGLIDLAWAISRGDARIAEQLVQVNDDTRLAFARFLARQGKATETLEHIRQVRTPIPGEVRDDLIRSLIQHKAYPEAYEIWSSDNAEISAIKNGSFEGDLVLENPGFGWQAAKVAGVSFALDVNQPHTGSRSLRISFDGYENQEQAIVSQLVLVKSDHTYHLTFTWRTRDLVTGGLPAITVSDAATGQMIARSEAIQPEAKEWTSMRLEFKTLTSSKAVFIKLQRNKCSSSPCPVFGQVWLDSVVVDEAGSK